MKKVIGMDDQNLISTGLYRRVNKIVGSESQVSMRRLVMDLEHEMKNVTWNFDSVVEVQHLSGSKAEGLRFSTSDIDIMYIIRDIRVVFSLSQLPRYNNTTLLLAECERPGFYLLRLVTQTTHPVITDSCVKVHDDYYLPCASWRSHPEFADNGATIHGPCTSGVCGNTEYDFAYCVKSDIWPNAALGFIGRLEHAGWPEHNVLSKIINQGCLFVPIGSKCSPYEEYEWRLSFSLAEKTLIYNMTHSQFLIYGLLKIFLKEAIDINLEIKGLLCSYFLKTTLFWRITQQDEEWREENFLGNFWKCFQTLITYVISGYCPNFFIPENNMFAGKVEGTAKRKLLTHLTCLHNTGYKCLLQCPSMQDVMFRVFQQPLEALMLPSDQMISTKEIIDTALILEIWNRGISPSDDQQVNVALIRYAQSFLSNGYPEPVLLVVKTWIKFILTQIFVLLSKQHFQTLSYKMQYKTVRSIVKVIMLSSCDTVHHLINAAIVLQHFEYSVVVIKLLQEAKRRLQHPYLMYPWNLDVDKYRAAGGDTTPISDMMRTVLAFPVFLELSSCLRVLELEHEAADHHSDDDSIVFPPLVIANFLLFLCYRNEHEIEHSNAVLDELSTLVHYDDGFHIYGTCRAISWQLLGICQEMSGDYPGAYYSYTTAMKQRWCPFKLASELRIRNMCSNLSF